MLPLVILKTLADLGFYYSFAGFFAIKFGALSSMLLLSLAIQTAAFALSFLLEDRGWLRFAPFALILAGALLPGFCLAYGLMMIPVVYFFIVTAKNKTYCPSWAGASELFAAYWKSVIFFSLLMCVMRSADTILEITVPCAIITFCCCIMQTRSLRHDLDVYTSPLYQLVNAGAAVGLIGVTLLVSSKNFRQAVGTILKIIYLKTIAPLLLLFTRLMVFMFWAGAHIVNWILALFKVEGAEVPEFETMYGESDQTIIETDYDPNAHPLLKLIATVIIIAIALYLAVMLFRRLQGLAARKKPEETGQTETRSFVRSSNRRKSANKDDSCIEKIRAQYRSFLKVYLRHNLPLEKHFTSENVNTAASGIFSEDSLKALRDLYIRARYKESAGKDDVNAAKELVKKLREDSRSSE